MFFICLLIQTLAVQAHAQTDEPAQSRERMTVSLVTAAPGREVYQLEGHSALRLRKEVADTAMTGLWRPLYDVAVNRGPVCEGGNGLYGAGLSV